HEAGSLVRLQVERGETEVAVGVPAVISNDQKRARIGIRVEDNYRFEPEITFDLEPRGITNAAGLLLAIGVYDYLSADDLVADRIIAGTGVLDVSGAVSAANGLSEKLRAAASAGATLFLLPSANCQDIANGITHGLKVIKVTNFSDAVASLRALRDNPEAEVPSCEIA
ncbi:MAG: hypothetical protein LBJ43_00445, partial [Propionibacteriaceae bacterium]|nr:hypothetical protein [Propionibacteriaceae bacterium]